LKVRGSRVAITVGSNLPCNSGHYCVRTTVGAELLRGRYRGSSLRSTSRGKKTVSGLATPCGFHSVLLGQSLN